MVHFRLLALGLAASTASVALAAETAKSCALTCGEYAYQNGGGCKWEDKICVCKSDKFAGKVTDCVKKKKTCPELENAVKTLGCNTCGPKNALKQCQQAHKTPVAGKHGPDHQHKAKSADDHDHKHDHGHDDKDKHGHEGKHQDRGKHGDMPHAGYNKHGEAVFRHHGEHTRKPGHLGRHAPKSTTEQQGKPGVKLHVKHHDRHVGTVHSEPFKVPAGQHKSSKTPRPHDLYGAVPIPQRQGKHRVKPESKHPHGEHKYDYRGNKPPKGFRPEFVHPFNLTIKPENPHRHNHEKGTPQPEGHGKTSAEAPHGAHASDKKAPGTPKEGYKKQPEKQPRPAPKSGDKGNPPAKSAARHAQGGVTAAECEAKALQASKCTKRDPKCICPSQEYHASLTTCVAANTTAYEDGVRKYLNGCRNAGHPVPKGKQGSEPQPGAHAEAGKNPAGSKPTEQGSKENEPAGGSAAAQSKGKQGGEPQPGAQTEAGKNPAGSKPTEQGSKENEPAGGSAADSNYPACANPCISVAQEKSKSNCTTVECQCKDSMFRTQFKACVNQTCNQVDYNKTITVGIQACNAANNSTTGGDGSNNDNPNSNTNAGTLPSTPGVQQNKPSSAFGLRSSVGAVLVGAIGVAFATLL